MIQPRVESVSGALVFSPALPANWKGQILPGSHPYFHESGFGSVTIQKFGDEEFSICYGVLRLIKKIKFFWNEESLLRLQFPLKGGFSYKGEGAKKIKLRVGQVNAVWAPGRRTSAEFTKGTYEVFQIGYAPALVQKLFPKFPLINNFTSENSIQWSGEERNKIIYQILQNPYNESMRHFFYENKIRDLLLSFGRPYAAHNSHYRLDQIERINLIDHLMLSDLSKHHRIKDLAQIAMMSESALKDAYKAIIGEGIFERYQEARLQKAREDLLQTDVQVRRLYEQVGYESISGFIEAFRERFGLTPFQYRKKYKLFD